MRAVLTLILIVLGVLVVGLAVLLGLSLLVGWLLTLILPFTLFEGTLLGLVALIALGVLAVNIFKGLPLPDLDTPYTEDLDDFKDIPEERIFKTEQDRTLENQYRYEMANRVYGEFQQNPSEFSAMNDKQQQELALRLADIALTILKQKPVTATRLNLTANALKKQMQKMNQQPYSDDILDTALSGLNDYIFENFEDLSESIRLKDWHNRLD
ncbi:MAG: hypothetical protein HUU38_04175 [Anaerolineales bacterium]|nr:hypothetical protein [Anaerolineales bacterium]